MKPDQPAQAVEAIQCPECHSRGYSTEPDGSVTCSACDHTYEPPFDAAPAPAPGGADEINHKRIFEYDGSFKCLDCGAMWGELPGRPVMPLACKQEQPADRAAGVEPIGKLYRDVQGQVLIDPIGDIHVIDGMPVFSEAALVDSRSRVDELEREARRLQWQPIETAPRDGTEVDLWGIDQFAAWGPVHLRGPRRYTNCRWVKGSFEEHVWHHRNHGTIKATHWMPLPAAPTLATEGAGDQG